MLHSINIPCCPCLDTSHPYITAVVFLPSVQLLYASGIISIFIYALFIMLLMVSTILSHLRLFITTVYASFIMLSLLSFKAHSVVVTYIHYPSCIVLLKIYTINAYQLLSLTVVYSQYVSCSDLILNI
jgi:hypothetical protein